MVLVYVSVIRLTFQVFLFDGPTRYPAAFPFFSTHTQMLHTAVRMVAVSLDSPTWTFGLNPKHPEPRVPGPGAYDVAGRLDGNSVGTHFSRIGAKPTYPRADVKRLVFGTGRLHASPQQPQGFVVLAVTTVVNRMCHPE